MLLARVHHVALADDVDESVEVFRRFSENEDGEDAVLELDVVGKRIVGGNLVFGAGYDVVAEKVLLASRL